MRLDDSNKILLDYIYLQISRNIQNKIELQIVHEEIVKYNKKVIVNITKKVN